MSDLKWAFDKDANIKEPIDGLKQKGWQYGDTPTASNFNWLFKNITEQLYHIHLSSIERERILAKAFGDLHIQKLNWNALSNWTRAISQILKDINEFHKKVDANLKPEAIPELKLIE